MAWTTTADAHEFLAAAGAHLRVKAASNTVLLTAAESVAAHGRAVFGDEPPLFGWWARTEEPVAGAFVHTPIYPLQLSPLRRAAVAPLAAMLADQERHLVGVGAAGGLAEAFAAAWCARCDAVAEVALVLKLYRLAALREPEPPPPGRAEVATVADIELVRDWIAAFARETGALAGPSRTLDERLAAGSLTIWRDDRALPVALAGWQREVAGTRRVGPVYTEQRHRRRGYGSAVTAAACRRALAGGAAELLLYADTANPTSTALYRRLGFEPVEDRTTLHFKPRAASDGSRGGSRRPGRPAGDPRAGA